MNVGLTRLQPNKWSQDTSNLEALSIKVAYKRKIVHLPWDVWKSYSYHAGEMNNPKKAASSEQDPAASSECKLGSQSSRSGGYKLSPASYKWCQGEVGEPQRRGKWSGPPRDGSLKAFTTEPLTRGKKRDTQRERSVNYGYRSGWERSKWSVFISSACWNKYAFLSYRMSKYNKR